MIIQKVLDDMRAQSYRSALRRAGMGLDDDLAR